MANGWDRDWCRVQSALRDFHALYGHWPTRVLLDQGYIDEFNGSIFSPPTWARITAVLEFVAVRANAITVEDSEGHRTEYGNWEGKFTPEQKRRYDDADPEAWLGVTPDSSGRDHW